MYVRALVASLILATLIHIRICPAAPLTESDMIDYLAQSLCVDASGHVLPQVPVVDGCRFMRPQRAEDTAIYQKRDWPDRQVYPHYFLTGHQASDSVLIGMRPPTIEQTLDFGGDPHHDFEHFGSNDGGQVVMVVGGWASAVMTQGSRGEVQWFIGSGCRTSAQGARLSWLFFGQNVPSGSWGSTVAHLTIGHAPGDCPKRFNAAYTRFKRERVIFPFRIVAGKNVTMTNRPLDVIIVEHYGGQYENPSLDSHLERFFFARNLGWVRWERWQNLGFPRPGMAPAKAMQMNQTLGASARCPSVDYSTAPGPNWVRIDCRTWTTIVKMNKPWSVGNYRWPAAQSMK